MSVHANGKKRYNKASMFHGEIRRKIDEELERGAGARRDGFEGRARVCARRAAGIAIRAFLEQQGLPVPGPSAYDLLVYLRDLPGMSGEIREAAGHLSSRVDESFSLPVEIDLLAEARWLARELESQPGHAS